MFMFLLQQDKNAIEKKAPPLIKKKKTGASFSPPKVPGALLLQNLDLTDTSIHGTPTKPSSSSKFPRNIPRKFRRTSVWGFKT
ncbi:hypothetical protein YC2023_019631 [Brassica napus]